jgi:Xaa-Pro aminopeptidase
MRNEAVCAYMIEKDLDAVLFLLSDTIHWYFEGEVDARVDQSCERAAFFLLVTKDVVIAICPEYDFYRLKEEVLPKNVEILSYSVDEGPENALKRFCRPFEKLRMDTAYPDICCFETLENDFFLIMQELNDREIMKLRVMGKLSEGIMHEFAPELQPGMTELEIEKVLRAILIESGLEVPVLCVGSDDRIERYRFPFSTNKKVSRYLFIRAQVRKHGLRIAFSRYFHFGAVPQPIQENHEKVAGVFARAAVVMMKASSMGEVFEEIASSYSSLGIKVDSVQYPAGGSLGYSDRRFLISQGSAIQLKTPSSYVLSPFVNGAFSEDTILLKENGKAEFITLGEDFPKVKVRLESFRVHRPWILVI